MSGHFNPVFRQFQQPSNEIGVGGKRKQRPKKKQINTRISELRNESIKYFMEHKYGIFCFPFLLFG